MKKVLIRGPIYSCSGYGNLCRLAFESLKTKEDLYDIYIEPANWGHTGWLPFEDEQKKTLDEYLEKTMRYMQSGVAEFDISLQVTIPNEWKRIAKFNIGYTAGIETTHISPAWVEPSQMMDKIIVCSEHAKKSYVDTEFLDQLGNKVKVTTPIDVVLFPVKEIGVEKVEELDNLSTDFNYLTVCQWGPRKNVEQTIVSFIEEFKNESNVGLVLKVNLANDSLLDKDAVEKRLEMLLSNFKDRKCKIHLLHGRLTDEQMQYVYQHPKIKAIVSTAHAEGYGLPLFEAAYNELPVIATDWSAHLEFLTMKEEDGSEKKMFAKISCDIAQVQDFQVWKGVVEKESNWAYCHPNSVKEKMREVYKDYPRFKSWAKKLNKWIRKEFTKEKIYSDFIKAVEHNRKEDSLIIL